LWAVCVDMEARATTTRGGDDHMEARATIPLRTLVFFFSLHTSVELL
jgi:hypothetical protein